VTRSATARIRDARYLGDRDGQPAHGTEIELEGRPEGNREQLRSRVDASWTALASFERTLLSLDAPIDRFVAGDAAAISDSAKRGWELYNGKARCNSCHAHTSVLLLFTDEKYHNIGVAAKATGFESLGRRVPLAIGKH
jgi:cytochrome c peroxidase